MSAKIRIDFVLSVVLAFFFGWVQTVTSQSVSREKPFVFFLTFDDSASMGQRSTNPAAESWGIKIDDVRKQCGEFFQTVPAGSELRLYSFANELTHGPSITISDDRSADGRARATEFLQRLQVRGERTRFWWSLELVLDEAAAYIKENPNTIVRVIAYTDGLDNDPHRKSPQEVLQKHRDLLREHVQLTCVAIGFELAANDKELLENANVEVRTAMKPADSMPIPLPRASFRVSAERIQIGQTITVVNQSTGDELTCDWRLGDSLSNQETHPAVTPKQIGKFPLVLRVTDSLGRTDETQCMIEVVAKPSPKPDFAVAQEIRVQQVVLFVNRASGETDGFQWFVDGRPVSTSQDLEYRFDQPGEYEIRLDALFGRNSTSKSVTVNVLPPALPALNIVGPDQVDFAARLMLTCNAGQGDNLATVDKIDWYFGSTQLGTGATIDLVADSVGELQYRVVATTAYGDIEAIHRVTVSPPPKPVIVLVAPQELFVGEAANIKVTVTGNFEKLGWVVDGRPLPGESGQIEVSFTEPGDHSVQVDAAGLGGVATENVSIRVNAYPKPIAKFALGTNNPRVGDAITLIDQSSHADSVVWFVNGLKLGECNYVSDHPAGGDLRQTTFTPDSAGKVEIRQVATGNGGVDETSVRIEILPRLVAPQSCLQHRFVSTDTDGTQTVEFQLSAVGKVEKVEADYGGGFEEIAAVAGLFTRGIPPGNHVVRVKVTGAPEFDPELHEVSVRIPKPWPRWTRHIGWLAVLFAGMAGVAGYGRIKLVDRANRIAEQMITGALKVRPLGESIEIWQSHTFDGSQKKERVFLENGRSVSIRSAFNQVDGTTSYHLSLDDGDSSDTDVEIQSNEPVEFGGYEFCYLRTA